MTKKSSSSNTSSTQRALVSVVSGIVIVLIVLAAQALGLDIDVLEDNGGTNNTGTVSQPSGGDSGSVAPGSGTTSDIAGGIDGGWYQIYFTSPLNTTDEVKFAGAPIETALVNAINGAGQTIDAALFELNSQPVTDALIAANSRGVRVRMVTDDDHGYDDPESTFDQIDAAGIPVVPDNRSGLMHNKFFVIDGLYVWTGSTNITHNGMYNNNNNAMLIRSSQLAANYTAEFEEMFTGKSFGKTSDQTIANPSITVEGTRIETIFEAEGDAPARLIQLLSEAKTVRFMAFSFTRKDMFAPLIAGKDSMDIEGIVESSSRSHTEDLFCAGIDIKQDGNPDILHHKVFIIDNSIVALGSFNFSGNAADSNDENMLIIHNTDVAAAYLAEFDRRWAEAETMPASAFTCN